MVRQDKNLRNNINSIKRMEQEYESKRTRRTRGGKTRNERRKAAKAKQLAEETYFADTGCSPVKDSQSRMNIDLQRPSGRNQSFKEKYAVDIPAP